MRSKVMVAGLAMGAFLCSASAAGCDMGSSGSYSCAAYCLASYECSSDGDSSWETNLVTSECDTAAEAFEALVSQCNTSIAVAGAHCSQGRLVRTPAVLSEVCAPDR